MIRGARGGCGQRSDLVFTRSPGAGSPRPPVSSVTSEYRSLESHRSRDRRPRKRMRCKPPWVQIPPPPPALPGRTPGLLLQGVPGVSLSVSVLVSVPPTGRRLSLYGPGPHLSQIAFSVVRSPLVATAAQASTFRPGQPATAREQLNTSKGEQRLQIGHNEGKQCLPVLREQEHVASSRHI